MTTDELGYTEPAYEWISREIFVLFCVIISCILLQKEHLKRKSENIIFVSNALKILPLVCILSGVARFIFELLYYIPGLCFIASCLWIISSLIQGCCMGMFQLSRLFYSFSSSKTYTNVRINVTKL